jgi:hypothetical protein
MKVIYLTDADVQYIYADLKSQGLYEWYITLKCIEEIQCEYTFLSKITWKELLDNETIIDARGIKEREYVVNDSLKAELHAVMDILDIDNPNQLIIKTTAKDLYKHLTTYDAIKGYNQSSRFRIDNFRDYTVDINGVKTYAMKSINTDEEDKSENDSVSKYFLYIATHADKNESERPEQYKTVFYDKKIGIAKVVGRRMDELSKDKRHGGTLSPLYVKALRAWYMPTDLCRKLERELHSHYDERNTGGEWFSDYHEDIIPFVEKKIKKLIKQGNPILKINITEDNNDITFINKVGKDFWDKIPEEFESRIKFEL